MARVFACTPQVPIVASSLIDVDIEMPSPYLDTTGLSRLWGFWGHVIDLLGATPRASRAMGVDL